MTKKLKIALAISVLTGSFSCSYAGWFSFSSTYDQARSAAQNNNLIKAIELFEQSCNENDK